nr:hypothetical protein [uncultured Pseudoxanthomonas sp.]
MKAITLYMVLPMLALWSSTGAAERDARGTTRGEPLPPWREGELDIHHIHTGRGEAQLMVLPDGTSVLIDMSGKTSEQAPFLLPTRPDASRPPGEWVARYVRRVLPAGAVKLDYALISHFHGDHMGTIVPDSPRSPNGYQLSGITQVAESVGIAKVIDRGWPRYDYPAPIRNPTMDNYRRFLDWQIRHRGMRVEAFEPGRNDQIALVHGSGRYPGFEIRNLYANGRVWTGEGTATRSLFPPLEGIPPEDQPGENKLSIALRVRYGAFDYYTGGDLSAVDEEVTFEPHAWKNVEPPVAQAAGPVDAMKANHHGSWDANSIPFLAALRPRVIVVPARADGHPAVNTYRRMTSQKVWPGERDVFITHVSDATAKTTYGVDKAASVQGHVVIRVERGGARYRVFVLDDADEAMRVKAVHGPYESN